jgi:hemerythrin
MIKKTDIIDGVYYIEIPEADLYIQCGSPAESVKHLIKKGIIQTTTKDGVSFETGPNAILLSDVMIQNGEFSNMSEFSVLQMLYRQGLILPNHPNNTGTKPLLIGLDSQINSQMKYIFRGNYGLTSKEEISDCGIDAKYADELYRMKLRFAFGKLHEASNLLDSCIVANKKVEIRNGVFIERIEPNLYEISYKEQSVTVDLSLKKDQVYKSPYTLPQYKINKEYFSVIQSGQGDGWDIDRPSMNSIISFQGKLYLVDVVPNVKYILDALSIAINEIDGVFLTHCHDDHIAGITYLLRSDIKIKIYASKIVISSIIKKLSALLEIEESKFYELLDIHELELNEWNNIEELEVKPMLSPHPVETTIFTFRTLFKDGYKTYGHFADIADSKILENMIVEDDKENGISQELFDKTINNYKEKLDLKKVDIGGGMIHGDYKDFINDESSKVVLAHNARELSKEEMRIGTSSLFGINDIIIPTKQNYDHNILYKYLQSNFPTVDPNKRKVFLNFDIVSFNPKEIVLKEGDEIESLYLILNGIIEKNSKNYDKNIILRPGVIIGEKACLNYKKVESAFIARNYVKALKIPAKFFRIFVEKNKLSKDLNKKFELGRDFLETNLFGESISYPTLNTLINDMQKHNIEKGVFKPDPNRVYVVISGEVIRKVNDTFIETIKKGGSLGGVLAVLNTPSIYSFEIVSKAHLYSISGKVIKNIPVAFWKVLENYERVHQKLLTLNQHNAFAWNNAYKVGVAKMDEHHKKLFALIEKTHKCLDKDDDKELLKALDALLEYTNYHFNAEEKLLEKHQYESIEEHKEIHKKLINNLKLHRKELLEDTLNKDCFTIMIKEWLLDHILKEDTKYSKILNKKGIF